MVVAPGRARLASTAAGRVGTGRERSEGPAVPPSRGVAPLVMTLLALGVVGEALPVEDNARLVADNPGVMTWRTHHEVAGPELHLLPVVHDDLHTSGDEVPSVCGLTAVRLGDRLHVLGPLPPGLERCPTDAASLDVDQLQLARAALERSGLLGRIKTHANHSCHVLASPRYDGPRLGRTKAGPPGRVRR